MVPVVTAPHSCCAALAAAAATRWKLRGDTDGVTYWLLFRYLVALPASCACTRTQVEGSLSLGPSLVPYQSAAK